MLADIIQEFAQRMTKCETEMLCSLRKRFDFSEIESMVNKECAKLNAALQQEIVQTFLRDSAFMTLLKSYAGRSGMRFKEYRSVTVTLSNGCSVRLDSPYFIKATSSKRRKKRGPNGSGAHSGLAILGFRGHVSPGLLSDALQTALLCPSYEVAHQVLQSRGIALDVKTLRRLCHLAGTLSHDQRGRMALTGKEVLRGQTLVISADGGRLRERRRKRGRKPEHLKRRGYHSEWREPKLFTLYLTDETGTIINEFSPLHDATMANHEGMFALLESYLRALDIQQLARVVFCGDGSSWIWNGVTALIQRMQLDSNTVYQVLDYTHAKQNLEEIVALLAPDGQAGARKKWKELLWNGHWDKLENNIKNSTMSKANKAKAIKKFAGYFLANRERMRYAWFQSNGLPCGSGHVESAIRRVINLRLKAPGTFWLKERAESFLYLRAQLLSGRWGTFMTHLTAMMRHDFLPVYAANEEVWLTSKAA